MKLLTKWPLNEILLLKKKVLIRELRPRKRLKKINLIEKTILLKNNRLKVVEKYQTRNKLKQQCQSPNVVAKYASQHHIIKLLIM